MIRNINCSCPVKRKMEKIDNKNKSSSDVKAMGKTKMDLVPAKQPTSKLHHTCLEFCSDKDNCLSLNDILRSFNAPLSEEQAWSLIFQSVRLYRDFIHIEFIDKKTKKDSIKIQKSSHRIKVPKSTRSLNVHKDGFVHISDNGESTWIQPSLDTQSRDDDATKVKEKDKKIDIWRVALTARPWK